VNVNAVSGTTADGDALVADGPYGMWSLDAEQVRTFLGRGEAFGCCSLGTCPGEVSMA
jgi:hypothetical protein